jgi:hypothetical protein
MSTNQPDTITYHAMLVAWGQFAQGLGLIPKIEAIDLHQKKVVHSPQTKILEFLLSILAGLQHLQDLSHAAHPIDQDRAVAKAWNQASLADYSGVSRTLSQLSQAEADQIAWVTEQITKPILAEEVMQALKQTGRLVYDGDLTARPVSNTSTTYPGVAYGHMSDGLHLGYQAAMVSLHSPTYGRFWLSVVDHPGDTVSCTQAEALVQAAESQTGLHPLRRTDLLRQRLCASESEYQHMQAQLAESQKTLLDAHLHQLEIQDHLVEEQIRLVQYENQYQEKQRPERPYSVLAKTRQKQIMRQNQLARSDKQLAKLEKRVKSDQQQEIICRHGYCTYVNAWNGSKLKIEPILFLLKQFSASMPVLEPVKM